MKHSLPAWTKSIAVLLAAACLATLSILLVPRSATPRVAGPAAPPPSGPETYWTGHDFRALVIGINTYSNGWKPLRNALRDADEVGSVLERDYGFTVTRLLDGRATRAGILAGLEAVLDGGTNTSVLVYVAGHGHLQDSTGEGYWIPADGEGREDGAGPEPSWVPNSLVTAILNASRVRHVLVVADTCYSGALFRGEARAPRRSDQWYAASFLKPSRALLSSGGLEPVPDNGPDHSVFARQLLRQLRQPGREVFSASDLMAGLRLAVAAVTGQACEYGRLPIPSHRGGEFVFHRPGALEGSEPTLSGGVVVAGEDVAFHEPEHRYSQADYVRDALLLRDQGATNSASRLAGAIHALPGTPDSPLLSGLVRSLRSDQEANTRREVRDLIAQLQTMAAQAPAREPGTGAARPRVLALWPLRTDSDTPTALAESRAVQWALRLRLREQAGLRVVDRELLAEILQEQQLGSLVSDERVRQSLGNVLPASLHIGGEVVRSAGGLRILLTLTETATGEYVDAVQSPEFAFQDLDRATADLALRLADQSRRRQPLEAQVEAGVPAGLVAGIGRFHRATPDMAFQLVRRTRLPGNPFAEHRDEVLGTAKLDALGENGSEFVPTWASGRAPESLGGVWVVEALAQP